MQLDKRKRILPVVMHASKYLIRGFTIVELAIIITVIGILAGITVIGYGNWQDSVAKDAVESDLQMVATAMENAKNFSQGYPTSIPSTFKGSPNVTITYSSGSSGQYCIQGSYVSRPGVQYYVSSSDGKTPKPGTCT